MCVGAGIRRGSVQLQKRKKVTAVLLKLRDDCACQFEQPLPSRPPGVKHSYSYRTIVAQVCRGSSCKEIARELIASTSGKLDGASVSGVSGVSAGDRLYIYSNFAGATNRGRVSVVFLPPASGVEWWVGRLNNGFKASEVGAYTQWYHKQNNISASSWFSHSSNGQ